MSKFTRNEQLLLQNYSDSELISFSSRLNNFLLENFGEVQTKFYDHDSTSRKVKDFLHAQYNPFGMTTISGKGNRVAGYVGDVSLGYASGLPLTLAGAGIGAARGGLKGAALGAAVGTIAALPATLSKYFIGRKWRKDTQSLGNPEVISKLKDLNEKGIEAVDSSSL